MAFKQEYYLIGVFAVVLAFAVGISIGFYIYDDGSSRVDRTGVDDFSDMNLNKSVVYIPGVDNSGRGIAAVLETNVREGSGFVLVNINDLTAGSSTQESARVAAGAAKDYLNISDENSIDVIYNIKTEAGAIDGPSAGAAMAISLISLLENKDLDDSVSITGYVNERGFIGPSSGIEQKASALAERDIETLLVSDQVNLQREFVREESCEIVNGLDGREYCEVNYVSEGEIEISGINVVQVSDLGEALEYFLSE